MIQSMKRYSLFLLTMLAARSIQAQTSDTTGRFGFVINSSINGELRPFRLIPSVTYQKGNNQYELGIGVNPFISDEQSIWSADLNYKYYPNGLYNKYSMYLFTQFSYVNNQRNKYFSTSYNYLFLNGGYGFEINAFKGFYLGTNISIGAYTYSKKSAITNDHFAKASLFDDVGVNLAAQFNVGYRF